MATFGTYSAFDVFYTDTDDPIPTWKSILIQTGPDSYQEIYHDQPNEGEVKPSFLVEARQERYLCMLDNIYRWDSEEHCFWFGPEGVVKVDFSPVWEAARRVSPKGWNIWEYGIRAADTFREQQITVGFHNKFNNRCCEDGMGFNVWFTLKRGIVTVTRTRSSGSNGK